MTTDSLQTARRALGYSAAGIGGRVGFGQRPALVVVDLQVGFTDPSSRVGGDLTDVVAHTARVLDAARRAQVPVAFTAVGFCASGQEAVIWLRKMPGLCDLVEGSELCDIDSRVAPLPEEPHWCKRVSSAFMGTPLISFLTGQSIDTVVIAGCVTSGCVRATAVDAVSLGFRAIVPQECVGDRATAPHAAALFDIDAKYGDVTSTTDVLDYLERLKS